MIDLYNGDCLKVMDKLIADGVVVDAIITDPPYGTTACKWDLVIPFNECANINGKSYQNKEEFILDCYKRKMNPNEIEVIWNVNKKDGMWQKLNKLIKPNGAIVLFGSEPFSSLLRVSNINMYRYDWKYKKKNCANYPNAKNVPLKYIEDIIVFCKAKAGHVTQVKNRMVYNPQGFIPCNEKIKGNRGTTNEISYQRPSNKDYIREFKNYPKNIIEFDYDYGKQIHPTQKPIALMEYLIKTYTNENDLVLDFTMGSGTTGVACKNLNRNFIGIELDEKYFEKAKKRIEDTESSEGLFDE